MARKKVVAQIQKKPVQKEKKKKNQKQQQEIHQQREIPKRLERLQGQGIRSERKTTQVPQRRLYLLELGKGDIRRMARAGGVKRIGSDAYDVIRDVFGNCLHNIIKRALIYRESAGRQTILKKDIYEAARSYGLPTTSIDQS